MKRFKLKANIARVAVVIAAGYTAVGTKQQHSG